MFKSMPPLQRMLPTAASAMASTLPPVILPLPSHVENVASAKYPQFIEGKYNMKSKCFLDFLQVFFSDLWRILEKEKWILARNKTSTLRISSSACHGTFAVGVVHGSPDYFTQQITQLQHKNPKGIHPKKKDFTRGKTKTCFFQTLEILFMLRKRTRLRHLDWPHFQRRHEKTIHGLEHWKIQIGQNGHCQID